MVVNIRMNKYNFLFLAFFMQNSPTFYYKTNADYQIVLLFYTQVNYKDQAMFSFVYWPFSVKLLWAPIVDSVYLSAFGRRKSWLVPTQYLIGIFMLVLAQYIPALMGEDEGECR